MSNHYEAILNITHSIHLGDHDKTNINQLKDKDFWSYGNNFQGLRIYHDKHAIDVGSIDVFLQFFFLTQSCHKAKAIR